MGGGGGGGGGIGYRTLVVRPLTKYWFLVRFPNGSRKKMGKSRGRGKTLKSTAIKKITFLIYAASLREQVNLK